MTLNKLVAFVFIIILCTSCTKKKNDKTNDVQSQLVDFEKEKLAILETLHNETKAAFKRDYKSWQNHWVHDSTISKTYINFVDNSFSESIGWSEISGFVKTFIEEHPEPEPIPELVKDIEVRLYHKAAWVTYEQQDSLRGLKRETRLMEKSNGTWRIAGMHTTIYGSKRQK
ncbi:hypothetical protein [Aquimarina rubra]|uniref:SnoaL-like domain-containing protein n=1 Tax=Aquimarina rubra TaxID=1920033 RepID=A0ABW5LAI6_9FLAO